MDCGTRLRVFRAVGEMTISIIFRFQVYCVFIILSTILLLQILQSFISPLDRLKRHHLATDVNPLDAFQRGMGQKAAQVLFISLAPLTQG